MMFESLESRRLLAFNPTGSEQELLQLVNRFRTDPRGEFSRLIASTSPLQARDSVLQADLDYAQVNGSVLKTQLESLQAVPPVAWNEAIYNFSTAHNSQMIASQPPQQFHSDSLARRNALLTAGVNLRIALGERITSENVFGFGKSTMHIFGAFVIDWEKGGPNGMRADLGHRLAIANADFEQIGQAITPYAGTGLGPQVNTQVLANIENAPVMVVGAVFEDRNASTWYEAGEGLGNVQIVFSGSAGTFTATTLGAGGYQVALPAGTYTATATGGGMTHAVVENSVVVGASNVWKNIVYDPTKSPPAPAPPIAELDRGIVSSVKPSVTINLIANDRDPDGTPSKLTATLSSGTPASFELTGSTLTYTAPQGFSGVDRAKYTVTDDQGLSSAPGDIEVFVLNLEVERPWHNYSKVVDVNADGLVTPQDILTIINEINRRHARPLPKAGDDLYDMFGFLDTFPDGLLTPIDALLVINALNLQSPGATSGEEVALEPGWHGTNVAARTEDTAGAVGKLATPPATTGERNDLALASLYSTSSLFELEAERRRNR